MATVAKRAASLLIGLSIIVGCAARQAQRSTDPSEHSHLKKYACDPSEMQTSSPRWPNVPIQWATCPPHGPSVPPQWPTYVAKNYNKPGSPALTSKEISMVREALRKVKPCQEYMVLYAFPANPKSGIPFVVFFGSRFSPTQPAHVFWSSNRYFKWNGEVFTSTASQAMASADINYDIEHTTCLLNGTENGAAQKGARDLPPRH